MAKSRRHIDPLAVLHRRLRGIALLAEKADPAEADRLLAMLRAARAVFVTGAGRSGLITRCLAMRLMQMGMTAHVVGETTCPRAGRGDLLLAVSCSGETATTLRLMEAAAAARVKTAVVTARADSSLARAADHTVVLPAADPEVKRQYRHPVGPQNNTLFEEAALLYFDALAYALLEHAGLSPAALRRRHANLE
jgi:6-phospho-3-hexuloisomerase